MIGVGSHAMVILIKAYFQARSDLCSMHVDGLDDIMIHN